MWMVELHFTGDPARLAARAAHRDRLAELHRQGLVRMAGPLAGDGGAVIVIDAPSRADVEEFLAADPYFRTPGVTVAQIRDWRPFLH
ncbi:YciI family protein [Jidongwangia harbinensis]|uniref:YciI family protein n=1 Tax=Jidongwangia harbinensis TaxID=2878561 RepID=UPI001CDA34C9|nr:YciI family protein [Jidongwangia harbinensis]MCA2215963.1 YciI family protein [Jidongwangia harbinensis]